MRVVFSQPMYLPWQGLFDQLRHADIFVHYDDAQYSTGGFLNRVQLKTAEGFSWLTVPVSHHHGESMLQARPEPTKQWQRKHVAALEQSLASLPHGEEVIRDLTPLILTPYSSLAELNITLFEFLAQRFGIPKTFIRSSSLGIHSHASHKVAEVVKAVGGTTYITGHGARNYLDHALLEAEGITTEYIDYHLPEYPQKFGAFNPYVTVLTLAAAVGYAQVKHYLTSPTVPWRQFVERTSATA